MYFILRILAFVATRVYYRSRLVLGREHFRFKGPAIVVCNHPSTLLDVLNIGLEVRQNMYFLANYGLFRHPLANWLFHRLYCIPVMRREDVQPGEVQNNDSAFERSFQHLEKGGVLFIAAEGTSWMNRFVRPFRGGAARIAFGAEMRNNWSLGVKIIPVGVAYDAPHKFRSTAVIQAGEPVVVANLAENWHTDRGDAIRGLTARLEKTVRSLTVDTLTEEGEVLTGRLETIVRNEKKLPPRLDFYRSQALAKRFAGDEGMQRLAGDYFRALAAAGIADRGLYQQSGGGNGWFFITRGLSLLLFFPWFAAGLVFWALPFGIPGLVNRWLKLYVGYSSTVHILVGLFTVPAAFVVAYRLADHWSGVVLAIMTAIVVEVYRLGGQELYGRWVAWRWALRNAGEAEELLEKRREISEQVGREKENQMI